MRNLILVSILTFATLTLNANLKVEGELVETGSQKPIEFGTVRVLTSDSIFISGATTADNGKFSIELANPGSYIVEGICTGYEPTSIAIDNLLKDINLGKIEMSLLATELEEVTVMGEGTIRKLDRQVILPSAAQMKASTNGISLIQNLQLSRITVNALDKSIKTTTNDDVQLRINGAPATKEEVQAIAAKDVKRIDYYDNPGLRFGNAAAVLDFIVKRRNTGGSIGGDLSQGVSNLGWGEHNISGKYNFGNSSIGATAYWGLRDMDWIRENYETFKYPNSTLENKEIGSSTKFKNNVLNTSINYSYVKPEKSALNIALRNSFNDSPNSMSDRNSILYQDNKVYNIHDNLKTRTNAPALDIYYQQSLKHEQNLYFNIVGTYIDSDSHRIYSMTNESKSGTEILADVDGSKYSVIGEGIYERKIKSGQLTAGIKHTQAYVENRYSGDQNAIVNMNTAETYVFGEYQSRFKKLDWSIGIGVMRTYHNQDNRSQEKYIFRPTLSLSFRPNDRLFFRYNGYISGYAPSLSDLNNVTQTMDAYQIRKGNPNLKTASFCSNTLSASWNSKYINFELFGRYSYDSKPLMEEISFDGTNFVHQMNNQKGFHRLQTQLNININPWKEYLFVNLMPFFNRFISYGNNYTHTLSNWGFRGKIMGMYKNWVAMAELTTRTKNLWG